jgi:hypothetical protein
MYASTIQVIVITSGAVDLGHQILKRQQMLEGSLSDHLDGLASQQSTSVQDMQVNLLLMVAINICTITCMS